MLYEDDLGDFGYAQLRLRMRVQEDSIFVLLRSYIRVDKCVIRILDNRFFIDLLDFDESEKEKQRILIKQTTFLEESWTNLEKKGFKFGSSFNLEYNQADMVCQFLTMKLSSVQTLYLE